MPKREIDKLTSRSVGAQKRRISESFLTPSGNVDPRQIPDCNIFSATSMGALTGYSPKQVENILGNNPQSLFHCHRFPASGAPLFYATHTNSLTAGMARYRDWVSEQRRLKVRNWFCASYQLPGSGVSSLQSY